MARVGSFGRVAALSWVALALGCGVEEADRSAAPAGSAKAAETMSPPPATAEARATGEGEGEGGVDIGRGRNDLPRPETKSPQAIPENPGGRSGGSRPTMLAAVAFDLEGKLSADDVRKTIDESRDKFSRCLNDDSTVSVKAKVLPSGALSDVSVPSSVPNDAKLRDCVVAVLKTLTFPKPKGVEPAGLRLDLALKKQLSF